MLAVQLKGGCGTDMGRFLTQAGFFNNLHIYVYLLFLHCQMEDRTQEPLRMIYPYMGLSS